MKRLLLAPLLIVLLASCQTKRDICAEAAGKNITYLEAAKKLGLKNVTSQNEYGVINNYCSFYKK